MCRMDMDSARLRRATGGADYGASTSTSSGKAVPCDHHQQASHMASSLLSPPAPAHATASKITTPMVAWTGVVAWMLVLVAQGLQRPLFLVTLATTASFLVMNKALFWAATAGHVSPHGDVVQWVNACTTWVHSLLASVLVLTDLYVNRATYLNQDLVYASSPLSTATVAIATGYFIYDLWHIVEMGAHKKQPVLILHHVGVSSIYFTVMKLNMFFPYMVLTLLAEPHTFFMQSRKAFRLYHNMTTAYQSRPMTALYFAMWGANFFCGTFLRTLCHLVILYMVTFEQQDLFPQTWMHTTAQTGMFVISCINIGLMVNNYLALRKDVAAYQRVQRGGEAQLPRAPRPVAVTKAH